MRVIDIENYSRKNIYKLFRNMDYPYIGFTVNVDVTDLILYCKENKLSLFKVVMFLVSKTCNSIKEFKYRFLDEKVVEYDIVHPSYTLMVKDDAFNFCTVLFTEDFKEFNQRAIDESNKLIGNLNLDHEDDRSDLIFISCIPWISFTHVLHPIGLCPTDSIPRVAWGKYFEQGNRIFMPVNVQAHHALMDGFHIGIFYQKLDNEIEQFVKNGVSTAKKEIQLTGL
ncbi:MAG: chloramphenicol acetyltransferase [Ruminococcus flavefaciens]|nr:chloramphenicol acetyltransferase [Ruminococcus flavefaciens]